MGQTCAAGFYPAFSKNMEAIGLSAPNSLFATQEKALGTISQLAGLVKTFGMKVTIRELVIAGTTTERLATASAYYAAWYLGGAIGSLIVAADNFYACKAGGRNQVQIWREGMLSPEELKKKEQKEAEEKALAEEKAKAKAAKG